MSCRDPDGRFAERMLRELDNSAIVDRTLRGRSVRPINDADFAVIVNRGLVDTLAPEHPIRLKLDPRHIDAPTAALLASPPMTTRLTCWPSGMRGYRLSGSTSGEPQAGFGTCRPLASFSSIAAVIVRFAEQNERQAAGE